jgi:hypothetical protein
VRLEASPLSFRKEVVVRVSFNLGFKRYTLELLRQVLPINHADLRRVHRP